MVFNIIQNNPPGLNIFLIEGSKCYRIGGSGNNNVIPHISRKDRAHEMWSALTGLFQSSNENRKMVLREKLKSIKMVKGEVVVTYLTSISQVRDELATVGVVVPSAELVRTTLNGVSQPWVVFV